MTACEVYSKLESRIRIDVLRRHLQYLKNLNLYFSPTVVLHFFLSSRFLNCMEDEVKCMKKRIKTGDVPF